MIRKPISFMLATVAVAVLATGCMPKMTIEEMKAMMPEGRPAELDRLDAFAGQWDSECTMKMPMLDREEPLKAWGSGESHWNTDKTYLVGDSTFTMEEFGEMYGHETWSYDSKAKLYRSTWTDSMGSTGTGTGRYDEATGVWYMAATSFGPHGKTTMKGTAKFIDDNTMEWTYAEYAMGGLTKTMEMTGTSKRKMPE